ncbi:zinc finger protein 503 [Schistocerca piceifrons]|uniref:zinc finger protein 503 n=1 Tax=Schistocerca piceifrons TaxID=274613 RepID=UPI001F5F258D|nr:zinc finger protein 503 [Schistocerca piceifrons]
MRKDMKKSSYYVWFLGAQEAKGLRGPEYILPALSTLIAREREVEPFKVTLQVSHKGLKIIQNVPKASGGKSGAGGGGGAVKWETVKHLVPAEAVTCALQQADVVAAILLLVNPATRCPVHVHAYRCDSVETASLLRAQLAALAERPDTLRRIAELEARLRSQGLLPPPPPAGRSPPLGRPPRARRPLSAGGGSDGRSSSTRESDSSGSSGQGQDRIASLYDSLAAELRAKLGSGGGAGGGVGGGGAPRAPLLLPPRDYDTVHRARGNMAAVDLRRSAAASAATPGKDATATGAASTDAGGGSSGPSSGIGSDHAPSPDRQSDPRFLDNGDSSGKLLTSLGPYGLHFCKS